MWLPGRGDQRGSSQTHGPVVGSTGMDNICSSSGGGRNINNGGGGGEGIRMLQCIKVNQRVEEGDAPGGPATGGVTAANAAIRSRKGLSYNKRGACGPGPLPDMPMPVRLHITHDDDG
ncbi:hypothetical protein Vafri_11742 [Volvox africanus]|uniref:Uncharacterized protein n=1 Tax=Volvox africanus TaxID=51714 RepID=A0A8J4F1P8_9CHLO|nr:hypothetical protein Vafri_11742 [Volvox africanus]